ncbi:ADP-ribosylation factor-like protein 9 isoform X2 [Sphaerodactylus townsendi]|uniref:ADP-ribosylation factor-like protein 9 isoform X2 n=1 Tax=Sphaerodactylus townsendi TaxID=933632 RepID=UPI002025B820|nr:ADP-ribosylation factor-like protein 9 isoform X2 [Sphaerodactylus townsendi]
MSAHLRHFALVGTAVAVTGGVAYVVWRSYRAPKASPVAPRQPRQLSPECARLDCAEPPPEQVSEAEEKPPNKQILVLGLDGAGKTSILHSLTANQVKHSTAPTEGFNAVCVSTEDSKMEFLEIGGSESLRSYWKMYLSRVLLLIFVVDSADHKRLPVAKKLLHQLVQSDSTLPVMILANKQDLEGAYCITDIHDALALSDIGDQRKMFLIGTHVAEDGSEISSGMKDMRELIAGLVLEVM